MKSKYLVLFAMCSMFCLVGASCKGDDSTGSNVDSSASDSMAVETPTKISVNQKSVTLSVGESFTLTADAKDVEAVFVWSVDGDYNNGVVTLTQANGVATIKAEQVGETQVVVSTEINGYTYFETVRITVKGESGVSVMLSGNITTNENGYYVRLATIPTENGDVNSIMSTPSVYKDNKLLPQSNFTWKSADETVVKAEGNSFTSVNEGVTEIIGSYEVDGKPYTVKVVVEVYRPTIALEEHFTVEVENLQALTVNSTVRGIATDVLYKGQSVGSFNEQTKTLTLEKAKLPKQAADMGENCLFSIETSLASYTLPVNLYTKIISSKAEFEGMASLAKAANANPALWDGYFVLGDDIVYDGLFQSKIADLDSLWNAVGGDWSNGGLYGFKGVFDGQGHTIQGIRIDKGLDMGSIFGVLHIEGVIKNVAFTDASVAANSSLVCHAGGGTVENIYVQYRSIGQGVQRYELDGSINNHCGTFFTFKEPTATANVSNCVIDVMGASINKNASVKVMGSEYVTVKNVFMLGGTKALQEASNATLAFSSVQEFMNSTNAQSRYKKFDDKFWHKESGAPISQGVYEEICADEVSFIHKAPYFVAGTEYRLSIDNYYTTVTVNGENVTLNGNTAILSAEAVSGAQITFTVSSIFDDTKTDSFTCTVTPKDESSLMDLTGEATTAFYDVTENALYLAELGAKVVDEVLYVVNPDYTAVVYPEEGESAKTMIAITKDNMYKVQCVSVTKVIATAEDLQYIRKDYTVTSHNNPGCYDGKIEGQFVLINDINCTGLTLANAGHYWEASRGFGGTLDGRGYAIKNLTVTDNGLFGAIAHATIKNISFTGIRLQTVVGLFANRMFDTELDNVSMEFVEYVEGENIYGHSGLMFHDVSFDCTFKNVTLDISKIENVEFLTECLYNESAPYGSEKKSVYENVTVIVADLNKKPVFAYNIDGTVVEYPTEGFVWKERGDQ